MNIFDYLDIFPQELKHFLLTTILSFVVGLEFHNYRRNNKKDLGYGTSRTLTLVGAIGYVAFIVDANGYVYLGVLLGLTVFLGLYYKDRIGQQQYSIISPLTALFTYLIAPVVIILPDWFSVLYVAVLLLILGAKPKIREFSDAVKSGEMVTFTKFLVMAAVVLPLLPDKPVAAKISVTYFQAWTALLVVSGISYVSYLMQTYWFKNRGLLVTGVLGGIYSSTVSTVVLARRASGHAIPEIGVAILLASVMMYLRLLVIVMMVGETSLTSDLLMPFALMISWLLVAVFLIRKQGDKLKHQGVALDSPHPLEFKTALTFSALFVVFAVLTHFVTENYGQQGLQFLSFVVGLMDIDPYVLSLVGGEYSLSTNNVVLAILVASGSNNLMKAIYASVLGKNKWCYMAAAALAGTTFLSFLAIAFV